MNKKENSKLLSSTNSQSQSSYTPINNEGMNSPIKPSHLGIGYKLTKNLSTGSLKNLVEEVTRLVFSNHFNLTFPPFLVPTSFK